MIQLEHVTKAFRGRRAVDDVSLEVRPAEILGLLGPNGAGKTTLLGLVLGLIRPDRGEARIQGASVWHDRARALRGVGAAFETPRFHEHLSGWDNLRLLASWSGTPIDADLDRAVAFVGLEARIHDRAGAYSRGMRLRLALAQAVVPQPRVVVLDEPMEGLDPAGVRDARTLIRRLRDEWHATVVLSSHLLGEVAAICDRVAILHAGRLVLLAPCPEGGGAELEARYLAAIASR